MDLNTILIILGVVALIALVVHGLWSNRREKSKYFQNANTFNRNASNLHRVGEGETMPQHTMPHQGATAHSSQVPPQAVQQSLNFEQPAQPQSRERSVDDIKISIPGAQTTAPQAPTYDMQSNTRSSAPIAPQPVDYPPVNTRPKVSEMTLEEAQYQYNEEGINSSSPEFRAELAEMSVNGQETPAVHFNTATSAPSTQPKQTSGFIQLYVIAPQNREFNGYYLAQALDNLGFIIGNNGLYHRHLDLSVASPILFSLANLEQPGSFPYNMTEFSTFGVVLFMELPSPGSDLANLKMMLRAAKTLAEDLGGVVLTEEEEVLNEAQEAAYLARVA